MSSFFDLCRDNETRASACRRSAHGCLVFQHVFKPCTQHSPDHPHYSTDRLCCSTDLRSVAPVHRSRLLPLMLFHRPQALGATHRPCILVLLHRPQTPCNTPQTSDAWRYSQTSDTWCYSTDIRSPVLLHRPQTPGAIP